MRLLALFVIGLCVSPVWAQPDTGVKKFLPRIPTPPVEPLPAPPEDMEKTIREFVDDANHDRFVSSYGKIYGARSGFFGANEWSSKRKSWAPFDIGVQSVSELQIKGDQATATVKYHFEPRPAKNDGTAAAKEEWEADVRQQSETVSLKMAPSPYQPSRKVWLLVPPETEPTFVKDGPLLNLVVYKMAQKPLSKSGRGAESLERLKWLGLAAQMFAQDFNQQFAFSHEYVRDALTPYLEDDNCLYIPATLEPYTFNSNLSERYYFGLMAENPDVEVVVIEPEPFIKNARQVVMFYEGHDQKPLFRYNGKAAICFVDGHTALITPDEARTLIWNPA